jgi:hypothetical protein
MAVSSNGRMADSQSVYRSSNLRIATMPMATKRRVSRRPTRKAPAKGLTAADKAATIVHLADTVKENVAHADTHVKMAKRSRGNAASVKHNTEHAASHTKNALDHAKKLAQKLALDPKYRPAIKELNQAKKLGTP